MFSVFRFLLLPLLFLTSGLLPLRAAAWEDANAAFAAGEYAKALTLYQNVIEREGPSAARLFNLGNTHAKLKEPGPAILAFERAALLAPHDADIAANLKLTREAASLPGAPEAPPWWKMPLYLFSLHQWSWIAAFGLGLIALLSLIRGFTTLHRRALKPHMAWLTVSGLVSGVFGGAALLDRKEEVRLAILTDAAPVLRLSPFATAAETGSPGSGRRVLAGERHAGWVHLTVPGSTMSGWIPESAVVPLVPGISR